MGLELMETPAEIIPAVIPNSNLGLKLTSKQNKFLASYQLTHNSTESAINAGYSVKTAPQAGCRMLKNPKIINGLKQWQVNKRKEISKDDFIDMALKDYQELEVTEPNKPRFLDLAGKTLGYTSNQTVNNTNILIASDELSAIRELLTKRGKQLIIPSETKPPLAISEPVPAVPEPENTEKTPNVNNT